MDLTADRPWVRSYAPGVPATVPESPESLVDLLTGAADRFGPRVALDFYGATTTYTELQQQVARAAEALRRLGVGRGDRVALVLPNCPQHVVAFYAVLRLGAVVVEHNPLYTAERAAHQLADHGADGRHRLGQGRPDRCRTSPGRPRCATIVAVDLTRALPRLKQLALRLPVAKARAARAAMTQPGAAGASSGSSWSPGRRAAGRRAPAPGPDDTALLQYTGGTTGTPKGAMLTHRNLRANAVQGRAWVPGLRDGEETVYAVLPLFHAYGLTLCLTFAVSIGAHARAVPALRPRAGAGGDPAPAGDLPAGGAADLRAARHGRPRTRARPDRASASRHLGRHGAAAGDRRALGVGHRRPARRGLRHDRDLAGRRWATRLGPSRRPGTVGVPFPSTDIRIVDPEDPSRDRRGRRGRRAAGPRAAGLRRLLAAPEETATALLPGRLAAHRRHRGDGRRRLRHRRRPDQGADHHRRIQRLPLRGGGRAAPVPGVADVAVGRPAARDGGEEVVAAVVLAPGATAGRGGASATAAAATSPATRCPAGSSWSTSCRSR